MIVILFSQACNETKWVNEQNGWLAADIFGVSVKKASVMKFLPEYYGTVDYDFFAQNFWVSLYVCEGLSEELSNFETGLWTWLEFSIVNFTFGRSRQGAKNCHRGWNKGWTLKTFVDISFNFLELTWETTDVFEIVWWPLECCCAQDRTIRILAHQSVTSSKLLFDSVTGFKLTRFPLPEHRVNF